MAIGIDADGANIPNVNMVDQGSDPTTPAAGHVRLYTKGGILYVRDDAGVVTAVGAVPALAEGQLAIGDASDELSALALGTEGQLVTADASGHAAWADAPAGGGGDMELIEAWTAPDSMTASKAFSSIAGTYRALKLLGNVRSTRAGQVEDYLALTFNDDAGANYDASFGYSYGPTWNVGSVSNGASNAMILYAGGASAAANYPASVELLLPDYAGTTFYKLGQAYGARVTAVSTVGVHRSFSAIAWRSTAAITKMTLFFQGAGNFVQGSTLLLYGLK